MEADKKPVAAKVARKEFLPGCTSGEEALERCAWAKSFQKVEGGYVVWDRQPSMAEWTYGEPRPVKQGGPSASR